MKTGILYNSYGSSASKGASILISKTLNYDVIDYVIDKNGRFILLNIEISKNIYSLVNVYAPNDKTMRNTFFKSIDTLLRESALGIKLLSGDFNETLQTIDRFSKNNNNATQSNSQLKKLIKSHNLIDIWRELNANKIQFTWKRQNNFEKSRIDFWLIDMNIRLSISSTDIRPAQIQKTDHLAISLKIFSLSNTGPGYWKMNNSFLKDNTYLKLINTIIDTYITEMNENKIDAQIIWDLCKIEIKENSIFYAKKKAKSRRERLSFLEERLKYINSIIDNNLTKEYFSILITEKLDIEIEIENIYNLKVVGAQIRSRTEILENEKNSKLFLGIEKSRQTRKVIHSLSINGEIINENSEILKHEAMFYEKLYTSDKIDKDLIENYLNNTQFDKTLNNKEASCCEGLLTLDEGKQAILEMKTNKAPGLSGLTIEFYQTFWPKIGELVIKSLNVGYMKGELSSLQKQSVISLLYKKVTPTI